jgi:DNA-binding XRE family transcriptional regulator
MDLETIMNENNEMKNEQDTRLERLQDNLPAIRKIAGWRAVDLGNLLGITKQSVSNLETRKSKITLMQYIAIRHMIDFQIAAHPENTALAHVVPLLLDSLYPDEKTYNEIKKAAEEMASAASGGVSDTVLSTLSDSLLSGIDASPPSDWTAVVVASAASCQDL